MNNKINQGHDSKGRFILKHWYKETRSNETNKTIYRFLRLIGYNRNQAKRIMYWSYPHIRKIIGTFDKVVK